MLKKSFYTLLLPAILLSACANTPPPKKHTPEVQTTAPQPEIQVSLIAINDLHGHLEGPSGKLEINNERVPVGGAQFLSYQILNLRQQYPDALLVAAGDMVGASPMLSSLFHDEPTIEALNLMKLDVTSVGNHEFDEGIEELLRLKRGGCHPEQNCKYNQFQGASFDILAANVIFKGQKKTIFPAYTIKEVKGVKIGFIGLTLEGTPNIVSPKFTENLTFLPEPETINRYARELQSKGVEAIVVLLHEGGVPQSSNPNACDGLSGPVVDIVKQLDPSVDVVISGHTHKAYNCELNHIRLTSAKSYGQLMTHLTLTLDPSTGDITRTNATNIPIFANPQTPTDPNIDALITKYKKIVDPIANQVIGTITTDLTRDPLPNHESILGRIIADAQLEAAKDLGAQIAFMNPGGIRQNLVFQPEPHESRTAGQVTYGHMFAVQPFANYLVVMDLTGQQIKEILEQQISNNKFLSVSKGFSYTYIPEAKPGSRIPAEKITLNGKPIGLFSTYRVVANSFLADGGDKFSTFAKGQNRIISILDVDALTQYFKSHQPVPAAKDLRIQVR